MRIESIKSKKLKRLQSGKLSGIHPSHLTRLEDALEELRKADTLSDIAPRFYLHPYNNYKNRRLEPDEVVWVMRVTEQWRLKFRLTEKGACDLDYVQYH